MARNVWHGLLMRKVRELLSAAFVSVRVAGRNLLRHRRRSLIAVGSVAFGIAALVIATGFTEWMFLDFREATIEAQYGHVQIAKRGFEEQGRADPYQYLVADDVERMQLEEISGIRLVTPRLYFSGLISHADLTASFIGEAVLPGKELSDKKSLRLSSGDYWGPDDRNAVLIGRGLADAIGVKAGDKVVLLVNTPKGGLGAVEATVKATFNSVSKAYDDSALIVSVPLARSLLKVRGVHQWRIYLDNTEDTTRVATALNKRFDPKRFEIHTWDQLAVFYTRSVELLRQQLDVLKIIVVVIILLGIGNTMMMSVLERTGEIGTVMALGFKRRVVLAQLVVEGMVIGLSGGMIGLTVAALISVLFRFLEIEMPPPPGLTRGYIANILIAPRQVVEALLLATLTTTIATLYPAYKASRMEVVDAIRSSR